MRSPALLLLGVLCTSGACSNDVATEAPVTPDHGRAVRIDGEQESSIVAIERLGGEVGYDEHDLERPAIAVSFFQNDHVRDADLQQLRSLNELREVVLAGTSVTDAGLDHLTPLTNLGSLSLAETRITGEGLALLKEFRRLEILELQKTEITDADLAQLRDLDQRIAAVRWFRGLNVGAPRAFKEPAQ